MNISGDAVLGQPNQIAHYFNLDNIRVPLDPSQPFGNAPRNAAGRCRSGSSTSRSTRTSHLTERAHLQFRAEAFNLLNRVNYLAPTSTCSAWTAQGVCTTASFGQIVHSTLDPRLIQLGLKLSF